jgi:hypothetical protein
MSKNLQNPTGILFEKDFVAIKWSNKKINNYDTRKIESEAFRKNFQQFV